MKEVEVLLSATGYGGGIESAHDRQDDFLLKERRSSFRVLLRCARENIHQSYRSTWFSRVAANVVHLSYGLHRAKPSVDRLR